MSNIRTNTFVLTFSLASLGLGSLGTSCVVDHDDLDPIALDENDDQTTDDLDPVALDESVDEVIDDLKAPEVPSPEAADSAFAAPQLPRSQVDEPVDIGLCLGGCNNPPPCHYGPGLCVGGNYCYYSKMPTGTICESGSQCLFAECISGTCVSNAYLPSGTPCDDGDPATVNDSCDGAGTCEGEVTCPGGCNNPPPCHFGPGQCIDDPFGGPTCYYSSTFNGDICDGGNQCILSECINGGCTNTWFLSDGTPCDDGDACTFNDHCDGAGACTGTPGICDDPFLVEDHLH
ncbi:MAG: hypothetical protein AAGF11_32350 [Myxococcota bacterium]